MSGRRVAGVVAAICLLTSLSVWCQEGNLVEYSYGGFGDGMQYAGPMLLPPMLKVYQDGKVIFCKDDGVWIGRLDANRLERLKSKLSRSQLLKSTRLVPTTKGHLAGFHGGMAYIRYLEGDKEVLLGSLLLPTRGPWHRFVKELWNFLPQQYTAFVPESIEVRVYPGSSWQKPTPWPFTDKVRLSGRPAGEVLRIADAELIQLVFGHLGGGFSWIQFVASEGDQVTTVHLKSVPGWYEPEKIELALGFMWSDYDTEQKRLEDSPK